MSDELVTFLRARLDEDEQVARVALACSEDGTQDAASWRVEDGEVTGDDGTESGILIARARWDDPGVVAHIARQDPARVLREVQVKRRILDEIVPSLEAAIEKIENEWVTDWGHPGRAEDLLRLLALPYAAHPDYQDEWKP